MFGLLSSRPLNLHLHLKCSSNEKRSPDPDVEDSFEKLLQADIIGSVARFLSPNEVAATMRVINKACARLLPRYTRVQLSHPVPHRAFGHRWCSRSTIRLLSLKKRLHLLQLTAASGCLDNLQAALQASGWALDTGYHRGICGLMLPLAAAAEAGHLHVCKWLHQQGSSWDGALLEAAEAGQQEVCEWMLDAGCPLCDSLVTILAAHGGHMELVESLMKRFPIRTNTSDVVNFLAAVAYSCELSILQRETQHYLEQPQQRPLQAFEWASIITTAASSTTFDWRDKLKWLDLKSGGGKPIAAYSQAVRCPDAADRLPWLRQQGYPLRSIAVWWAAKHGNLAALQYLMAVAEGGDIQVASRGEDVRMAARAGHLAALQLLHARGWLRSPRRVATAASEGGQLEVVRWMVQACGVKLDTSMLNTAARSGNLDFVGWLRTHGCPWDEFILREAAIGGCEAVLEFLVEQGCALPDSGQPYIEAAHNGDLSTLACLHRLGVPWGSDHGTTFSKCVGVDAPLSALQWLVEAGCPVDVKSARSQARGKDYEKFMELLISATTNQQQQQQQQRPSWHCWSQGNCGVGHFISRKCKALLASVWTGTISACCYCTRRPDSSWYCLLPCCSNAK